MKKLILLCIILVCTAKISAKQIFTVVIADPKIGESNNAEKLIRTVDDINNRDNIVSVAVLGNLTAEGRFEQFIQCQEILDGLNAPYLIVGGNIDYLQSEGKGIEISMIWDAENFLIEDKNGIHLGLNTFQSKFDNKNYISVETINWIRDNLQSKNSKEIFIYTYNAFPEEISNWGKVIDVFAGFKVYPITLKDKYLNKDKILFQCGSLSADNFENYVLFYNSNGMITFFKVDITDSTIKGVEQIVKKDFTNVLPDKSSAQNFTPPKHRDSRIELNKTVYSSPVFDESKLIISTKDGTVYCFANDGKEKWKYETNGTIYSSPIIDGDLVAVVTNEGDLFTLNSNTGNLFQVIGIGETITSNISLIELKNNKSTAIAFGTASGNFYCYDLYSLEFLWQNSSANDWITNSVSSNDGKIFLQDRKGTLYCVSVVNGILLWKWQPGMANTNPYFKSDILLNENDIYLVDSDGNFICIDALLGTEKWNIKKIDAAGIIRFNKGDIILSTNDNEILKISTKLGRVLNKIDLPLLTKNESVADIIFIDDKMLAGFTNGEVYLMKENKEPEFIYNSQNSPIVSLINLNGNCLVTDFDGKVSLVKSGK